MEEAWKIKTVLKGHAEVLRHPDTHIPAAEDGADARRGRSGPKGRTFHRSREGGWTSPHE